MIAHLSAWHTHNDNHLCISCPYIEVSLQFVNTEHISKEIRIQEENMKYKDTEVFFWITKKEDCPLDNDKQKLIRRWYLLYIT